MYVLKTYFSQNLTMILRRKAVAIVKYQRCSIFEHSIKLLIKKLLADYILKF